ncbi:MAG: FAD-dependent 5-carboxymethylaminomethyl-2-thiouridine(34) oxidoreductase MnmC [Acidobacteriota bacterium]|nr:FAD-dependent 5-carboxymethylaminomethyl-2-thiouridine(34) oxidoreductase MnmC [Acidobacteriota bacterium]
MTWATAEPWFAPPAPELPQEPRIVIIGAGIAGAAAAHAFARHNRKVLVLEKHRRPAEETSGNPVGVVYPFISVKPDPMSLFFEHAYGMVLQRLHQLEASQKPTGRQSVGVLHLLAKDRLRRLHKVLRDGSLKTELVTAIDAGEAARRSGLPIEEDALYYPQGCYVEPPLFTRALLDHPLIEIRSDVDVRTQAMENGRRIVMDEKNRVLAEADIVILATGDGVGFSHVLNDLPVRRSRGQLLSMTRDHLVMKPRCVICHKGYLVPGPGEDVLIGATWKKHEGTSLHQEDQEELLNESRTFIPGFALTRRPPLRGRVAFRARTPDHLPIVGPVPDWEAYRAAYEGLNHGAFHRKWRDAPYQPGLYVSLGHGGRGMVSTVLSGEILAAQVLGHQPPVPPEILGYVHPGRYVIRNLKRGR